MKKIGFLSFFILLFTVTFSKSYKISGTFLTKEQPKYVYLYDLWGNYLQNSVDSSLVKKGVFTFTYEDKNLEGLYYIGANKQKASPIIIAEENISVIAQGIDFSSISIENSPANTFFKEYLAENKKFEEGFAKINKEFQEKVAPLEKVDAVKYNQEYQRLVQEIQKTRANYKTFLSNLTKHSNSFVQKIGNLLEINDVTNQLNYFSKNEFYDESITRGDFIVRKVNLYFTFFSTLNAKTLPQQTELLLQISPQKSKARGVVFEALTRAAISNDPGFAKKITEVFLEEYPNEQYPKDLIQLIPNTGEVMIGDVAPEINLPDFNGKNIALSSLRGKVVLIDFWASWCGPCRGENPNVVRLYNEYKNKGFTVYSVSLDGTKSSWLKAVQKDGLAWENHVSELKRWDSSAARTYKVQGIPATFLIDENGVVIGKNLRGAALEQKLAQLFSEK